MTKRTVGVSTPLQIVDNREGGRGKSAGAGVGEGRTRMSTRKPRTPKQALEPEVLGVAPPMPPEPDTPEEQARREKLMCLLREATRILRQRNLDRAVLLAQQAARLRGPLVDHFCELGRRFGHTLDEPQKPALRVIEGGDA